MLRRLRFRPPGLKPSTKIGTLGPYVNLTITPGSQSTPNPMTLPRTCMRPTRALAGVALLIVALVLLLR